MAKEDFCFTYYDGDAARDKAHMNRLQRGAYEDFISAQRKRGHLSLEDVKLVLGNDFDYCWPALEWVLKNDNEGKFFIEWVENSVKNSQINAKKNKEKSEKYWADVEAGIIPPPKNGRKKAQKNTKEMPQDLNGIKNKIPLENGNGNENTEEFKEGVIGGEKFDTHPTDAEDPKDFFYDQCIVLIDITQKISVRKEDLKALWPVFKQQNLNGKRYYPDVGAVYSHFMNWSKTQKFKNESDTKTGTSQARIAALKNLT